MTMINRSVGSLCTQSSDLPECQCAWGVGPSPVGRTCSQHARNNCLGVSCASLLPLCMKWACICAGNGCCVWWCFIVFGCVSMRFYVLSSLCCWLPSMRWLVCGDDGSKKTQMKSVITEKYAAKNFFHYSYILIRKNQKIALNYSHYSCMLIQKQRNLHHAFLYLFPPRWYSAIPGGRGSPPDFATAAATALVVSSALSKKTQLLSRWCPRTRRTPCCRWASAARRHST